MSSPDAHPDDVVTVRTVTGPVPVAELGVTMMHEHTVGSLTEAVTRGARGFSAGLAGEKVSPAIAWLLREDPYSCPDNVLKDDEDLVVEELGHLVRAGGRTVVDNSTAAGRNPAGLVRVARRTGLNVVMGSGWSFAHGTEDAVGGEDPEDWAAELITEHREGVPLDDGTRVFPGIIGEIGVGVNFTASERMTLDAVSIAQPQLGVPLTIHLPGWQRRAHEVLDIVFAQGVDPRAVVLCHMDPSGKDPVYQREVAARGVWLEYDMIGMLDNFPGEGQSPSVQDSVDAVSGLIADGLAGQLLLSQDVFLKDMYTRNGGNGYAYVLTAFLPRLVEAGVPEDTARSLLTDNPAALFTAARSGTR